MELVLTFTSTNYAISAEHELLNNSIIVKIMPLPSAIRAGCGICLRVLPQDISKIQKMLMAKNIKIESIYFCEEKNGRREYFPYE